MTTTIRIGFIPLLDAALLIAAARRGFAEDEGLDIVLSRETAWAAIRDKLSVGLIDAAHYLAPAAVASNLGLGALAVPLAAPAALCLNGSTITLSQSLHEAVLARLDGSREDPAATARALARVIGERRPAGAPPLVFAHVFPFSTHHYLLRLWLASGGIDPDSDVTLTVVPPSVMTRSLARRDVDGFCAGAPWGEIAARTAGGVTLHRGTDFGRGIPEKVLALRASTDRDAPQTTEKLVRALLRSAAWCSDPGNREALAGLLASPDLLDLDATLLSALLAGAPRDERAPDSDFLRLTPDIVEPVPSHADWIVDRMIEAGQIADGPATREVARGIYRPDRFARAMRRD